MRLGKNEGKYEASDAVSTVGTAIVFLLIGLGAGALAWAVGLPNPLAWGVLGFTLLVIMWGAFVRASGSGAGSALSVASAS